VLFRPLDEAQPNRSLDFYIIPFIVPADKVGNHRGAILIKSISRGSELMEVFMDCNLVLSLLCLGAVVFQLVSIYLSVKNSVTQPGDDSDPEYDGYNDPPPPWHY
jgi:hypothetical protein